MESTQAMLTTLSIVMGLLFLVYFTVIVFGFINVNTFLVRQGRYKNYFMLSFYTMSQICLIARMVDWGFFFVSFVSWVPDVQYDDQSPRVNANYMRATNTA